MNKLLTIKIDTSSLSETELTGLTNFVQDQVKALPAHITEMYEEATGGCHGCPSKSASDCSDIHGVEL